MERGSIADGLPWNVPSVNQDLVLVAVHTGDHSSLLLTRIDAPSVSSVPGRAAHRLRLRSVSGRSADVSAAKRSIWDGFIQVSAVHTFCEPVRSPHQSAWMKTITVSGFLFFSCSSHRFAPPPPQSGWDGWMDGRMWGRGHRGFWEPGWSFSYRKKNVPEDKGGVVFKKRLAGFGQGFLKRHEREKAAVSTTSDLLDPHATPPWMIHVWKYPKWLCTTQWWIKTTLNHLMYFRVMKHLHFTLWCQDNSGGNTGPQSSVIYCYT